MKLLAVIDMQNDFVTGVLGTKEAESIVPGVVKMINSYDGQVVYTKDTHTVDYLHTMEGKKLPVTHCVAGTEGWQLVPEIKNAIEHKACKEFCKPTFGSLELQEYVKALNEEQPIEQIDLIGVCTDICVISNALLLKATVPEVKICVYEDLTAGVTEEIHLNALNAMKMCHIDVERMW
ncbi:MAG: isochorismatase family cysteine hydrolase [bacterium]|nr:isochorismatase family cysteine hydrolase [bacterium]